MFGNIQYLNSKDIAKKLKKMLLLKTLKLIYIIVKHKNITKVS